MTVPAVPNRPAGPGWEGIGSAHQMGKARPVEGAAHAHRGVRAPALSSRSTLSCEVRHWLSCLQLLIYTPTTVSGIEWIVNRHYWLNEWTVKSSFAAMWVAERNRGDMSLEARQTQGLHRELFLLALCLNFLTYKMGIIYRLSRIHVKFKWQCILISQLMYLCI